jgi:hypothetical protein
MCVCCKVEVRKYTLICYTIFSLPHGVPCPLDVVTSVISGPLSTQCGVNAAQCVLLHDKLTVFDYCHGVLRHSYQRAVSAVVGVNSNTAKGGEVFSVFFPQNPIYRLILSALFLKLVRRRYKCPSHADGEKQSRALKVCALPVNSIHKDSLFLFCNCLSSPFIQH